MFVGISGLGDHWTAVVYVFVGISGLGDHWTAVVYVFVGISGLGIIGRLLCMCLLE